MTPRLTIPFVVEGGIKFVRIAFFFIPTQVGVSEGTYAILFDTLGLTAAAGVSLAFIRRPRTLAVAAQPGSWPSPCSARVTPDDKRVPARDQPGKRSTSAVRPDTRA